MPDEPPSSITSFEPRHLPVLVQQPRTNGESWLARILRTLFGWKTGSIRADLKDVLDAMTPGESGFSPEESRMLKNILGLHERRIGDVMIPRPDIIAVHQDIKLGELMRTFERAGHSRLVVYDGMDRVEKQARTALEATAEGDTLRTQLAILKRFSKRAAVDTIALRRNIAAAVLAAERYPFEGR